MLRPSRLIAALLPVLAVAACAAYDDESKWRPGRVNDSNLAMMVEDPRDLQRGRGATGGLGVTAGDAVNRFETDRVRQLPASAVSRLATQVQQSGAGNNASR